MHPSALLLSSTALVTLSSCLPLSARSPQLRSIAARTADAAAEDGVPCDSCNLNVVGGGWCEGPPGCIPHWKRGLEVTDHGIPESEIAWVDSRVYALQQAAKAARAAKAGESDWFEHSILQDLDVPDDDLMNKPVIKARQDGVSPWVQLLQDAEGNPDDPLSDGPYVKARQLEGPSLEARDDLVPTWVQLLQNLEHAPEDGFSDEPVIKARQASAIQWLDIAETMRDARNKGSVDRRAAEPDFCISDSGIGYAC